MIATKTIKITGQEILEYYLSLSENCTILEAKDILKSAEVSLDILEEGDYDRGRNSIKKV